MNFNKLFLLLLAGLVIQGNAYNAAFTVNTTLNRKHISPLNYGGNFADQTDVALGLTLDRIGGDRLTCYNWENNASNGGSYMGNPNDNNMVMSLPANQQSIPGIALTKFQDFCVTNKLASIITVQMGGYVSADMNGTVTTSPPNSRWKQIVINKGSAYATSPNLADGVIYLDEMVNMLITKYGKAGTATGIPFYQLDNEPNIWNTTHPIMHPAQTTCAELIRKSVQTAAMIKRLDPNAQIVGPTICCSWNGFADWDSVKGSHTWFVSWYLDQMKKASDSVGTRLLDVVDLHYPSSDYERGLGTIYHTVFSNIDTYYPGTKFGVTEWTWGTGNNIATALSVAFVLGTNASYGVYLHAWWGAFDNYTSSAFRLFRNYDGRRSGYGDTNVAAALTGIVGADTADTSNTRVFASVDSAAGLHIMLLNKKTTDSLKATISITSGTGYQTGAVYQITGSTSNILKLAAGVSVTGNSFSITVPPASLSHIVLAAGVGVRQAHAPAAAESGRPVAWLADGSNRVWYSIPPQERADIAIVDAQGRMLSKVRYAAGTGSLALRGAAKQSGILFVTFTSGDREVRQEVSIGR